jgi:drug/metabolite transporter (DMT)-like permease
LRATCIQVLQLTPRGWLFVVYVIAVPTVFAYLANAWALGRTTPTVVTIYIHMQAPMAALLAYLQLGQIPSPKLLVAAPLIAAGVAVVVLRKAPPLKAAAAK